MSIINIVCIGCDECNAIFDGGAMNDDHDMSIESLRRLACNDGWHFCNDTPSDRMDLCPECAQLYGIEEDE